MLISNVGSKRQKEELMKWANEEDVTENIKEGLKMLTAVTRIKLTRINRFKKSEDIFGIFVFFIV